MFKGLSNLASLMANAGEIKARAAEMKDKVAAIRVEGVSGGGMVRVQASGDQKIVSIQIEESLVASFDREMLEELVLAATNQALEQVRQETANLMSELAGGLGIPGLDEALSQFGMG